MGGAVGGIFGNPNDLAMNMTTFLPAAIVLESDGAQNRGTATPEQAAEYAKQQGVRIYGVALGKPNGCCWRCCWCR